MKEKDNKVRLLTSLLVILAIAIALAYLFSDKLVLRRTNGASNVSDGNGKSTCIYSKLKTTSELTTSDTEAIIETIEKNNNIVIDSETVKINLLNDYIYEVAFELIEKNGSYALADYVWKESGSYKTYGAGSMHSKDELNSIEKKICDSCGNCAVNNTCSYEQLPDPTLLINADKEEIISTIERENKNVFIDKATLDISAYDKNIYQVNFETKEKVGAFRLIDFVWKENGIWRSLGAGSDFSKEQLETLQGVISIACEK